MDETPTPQDTAGIRDAIEKMRSYCGGKDRADFWGAAVRIYPPTELDHLVGFVDLSDLLLRHVEQTYGVCNQAVLDALEEQLDQIEN